MFKILVIAMTLLTSTSQAEEPKEAIFAGGCFWCMESDFEKLGGVANVISGYTGGTAETADYKTVSVGSTEHREAVKVIYDPEKISYTQLIDYFWHHVDPTDAKGQFCDKGFQYTAAIYYQDKEERAIAENSKAAIKLDKPVITAIEPASPFYDAEDYHQGYYKRNPIRYSFYRGSCGRDRIVKKIWATTK